MGEWNRAPVYPCPPQHWQEDEERDRREWIEDVKRRYGIRCVGDETRETEES